MKSIRTRKITRQTRSFIAAVALVALFQTLATAQLVPHPDAPSSSPTRLRGVNFNPLVKPESPDYPWLMFYPENRSTIRTALKDLVAETGINFIDVIVPIPWTLLQAHTAPHAGQPLKEWASISFLNNLARFIDDCHDVNVSVEIDLADNLWIPYSVDSAHHIGHPGDPWWPVADDTPWDESATWYTEIMIYVEGQTRHPENIAMWCMFGNYQVGGAEPCLWQGPHDDTVIVAHTEQFVKNVWPAFKSAGHRPKAAPVMLPIFARSWQKASPEERLSGITNLKKWLIDDLALAPDYWVMTTYPFCDPASDGFSYLKAIVKILGPQNASHLISTDFKWRQSELTDSTVSMQGHTSQDALAWHFQKCAEYGFAGWWIWTYQDTPTSKWGIRDIAGHWKPALVHAIKAQQTNTNTQKRILMVTGERGLAPDLIMPRRTFVVFAEKQLCVLSVSRVRLWICKVSTKPIKRNRGIWIKSK